MERRDFLKKAGMGLASLFTVNALGLGLGNALLAAENAPPLHPLASNSTDPVGVRLVCWFDTSGSIDEIEYKVQKEAMARAIASDDFRDAIFFHGGPQSIALCVGEFNHSVRLRLGWVDFREGDDNKLKTFAEQIRALPRIDHGGTNHTPALQRSLDYFKNCPWEGKRNIVDILTDGTGYASTVAGPRKELARKYGATVNALITLDPQDPGLEQYCRDYLVTQPGDAGPGRPPVDTGFVETVATQMSTKNPGAVTQYQQDMTIAFRKKIFREIASLHHGGQGRGISFPGPSVG